MTCEGEPELLLSKTRQLLSDAQLLLRDMEELLESCTVSGTMVQRECEASIEEDGDTLIIEGFRFESAASGDELRKLRSKAGAGGRHSDA